MKLSRVFFALGAALLLLALFCLTDCTPRDPNPACAGLYAGAPVRIRGTHLEGLVRQTLEYSGYAYVYVEGNSPSRSIPCVDLQLARDGVE